MVLTPVFFFLSSTAVKSPGEIFTRWIYFCKGEKKNPKPLQTKLGNVLLGHRNDLTTQNHILLPFVICPTSHMDFSNQVIRLLNNRISTVAFVWKNGLFSQIADSRECLWFMLLRASRAESYHGFGEERSRDTKLSSFKAVLCAVGTTQVWSAPTCPVTHRLCRTEKKWGWRCKTTC